MRQEEDILAQLVTKLSIVASVIQTKSAPQDFE